VQLLAALFIQCAHVEASSLSSDRKHDILLKMKDALKSSKGMSMYMEILPSPAALQETHTTFFHEVFPGDEKPVPSKIQLSSLREVDVPMRRSKKSLKATGSVCLPLMSPGAASFAQMMQMCTQQQQQQQQQQRCNLQILGTSGSASSSPPVLALQDSESPPPRPPLARATTFLDAIPETLPEKPCEAITVVAPCPKTSVDAITASICSSLAGKKPPVFKRPAAAPVMSEAEAAGEAEQSEAEEEPVKEMPPKKPKKSTPQKNTKPFITVERSRSRVRCRDGDTSFSYSWKDHGEEGAMDLAKKWLEERLQ
jgi:hypothetical protein